jgi:putative glutamine amidotransferase
MTKKILLAPRFSKSSSILRASASTNLTDFLLDRNLLPFMSFYDTKFHTKEEAIELAKKYLDFSDALILQGGNDICPSLYKQINQTAKNVTQFRDVFELALIEIALQKDIPILGICRGMQMLNIFFGGSLHQNLDSTRWNKHLVFKENDKNKLVINHDKIHDIEYDKKGNLFKWVKKYKTKVNSEHHQGIDILANNLQLEAFSEDGLIEAFSGNNGKILGLQWHPELDLSDPDQIRILNSWVSLV